MRIAKSYRSEIWVTECGVVSRPDCGASSASAASDPIVHGLSSAASRGSPVSEMTLAPKSTFMKRSEEHTSELQSLMRISYAVFCLKKKKNHKIHYRTKASK